MIALTEYLITIATLPMLLGSAFAASPNAYLQVKVRFENVEPTSELIAFLGKLRRTARTMDYASLQTMVADQIFWEADHGAGWSAEKSGYDNLLLALSIDPEITSADYLASGWQHLETSLSAPFVGKHEAREGVVCTSPTARILDPGSAFLAFEATGTIYHDDWVYVRAGTPAFTAMDTQSMATRSTSDEALLLSAWADWKDDRRPGWAEVKLPSGEMRFIEASLALTFFDERLCFAKNVSGEWTISGYYGGGH